MGNFELHKTESKTPCNYMSNTLGIFSLNYVHMHVHLTITLTVIVTS